MSEPTNRQKGEDLAPTYALIVNGERLDLDVTQYVQSVSFDSALDMADMLEIKLANPGIIEAVNPRTGKPHPEWTAHKAFQPGNEIELRVGYGSADHFIGRAIITKHLPVFPDDGMPFLEVKGYDKSQLMMDVSGPVQATKENKVNLKTPRPLGDKDDQGVAFLNMRASDVVSIIADKYGFLKNIDPTDKLLKAATGDGIVQKKGMKDYELVKILANLNRREFFVNYDSARKGWVLNWVKPADKVNPELVFRYGAGRQTTLFNFDCQYGIREQTTDIVVLAWDDKAQRWVSSVIIESESGPDPKWRQGGNRMERQNPVTQTKATTQSEFGVNPSNRNNKNSTKNKLTQTKEAATLRDEIKQTLKSATQFRIAAGGTAIDVQVDRPFETLQDAANFALRWFRERQDHFLVGHGSTIGVETLRARQVHILDGLGDRLSGAYYFVTVRHTLGPDQGYKCEFTARKVMD